MEYCVNECSHLMSFFNLQDFRRDVEEKQATKTNISTLGKQIISSNITSDEFVKPRLQSIEDDWLQLICDLPNNEEALHTAQMELLPSRQALNDVVLWMDGVCNVLEEDNGRPIDGLLGLEALLQKYRVRFAEFIQKQSKEIIIIISQN